MEEESLLSSMRAIFGTKERSVIVIVTSHNCEIQLTNVFVHTVSVYMFVFCFCISMGEEEWLVGGKERSGSLECWV